MKDTAALVVLTLALPGRIFCADYNLGERAEANQLKLFNRTLDQSKAGSPETVFLKTAANDGLAWIDGIEFSEGTLELQVKGRNAPGQSFVGIAFHGLDNQIFDAVYVRPFNFQATAQERRSHSVQYICMPDHDWSDLRNKFPRRYEKEINPSPGPESWVTLKLVVDKKSLSVSVNGSDKPVLAVDLLNDRMKGKVGLWVGNGSDGWFRNLKVTPATK